MNLALSPGTKVRKPLNGDSGEAWGVALTRATMLGRGKPSLFGERVA